MTTFHCLLGLALPIVLLTVAIARRDQRSTVDDVHRELVKSSPWQPVLRAAVASYGLFALLLALSVVVFFMWPPTVLALLAAFSTSSNANGAFYTFSIVAVGFLLALLVFIGAELLRTSESQRVRLRRFLPMAAVLVVVGAVMWLLRLWALSHLAS
jgi:multisubunit Na+/H+ antiporter MnhB subunit